VNMFRLVQKVTYDVIAQQLDDIESWFKNLSIQLAGTRLETYKRNIKMLIKYHNEGKIREFAKLTDFKQIVFSLSESFELCSIYQAFKDTDPRLLRKWLALVAKGPLMIDQEDPVRSTGQARDFLFELNMMALLKARGIPVVLNSVADVHVMFEGKDILLECKRPQTRRSVEGNFLKASKQLTRSLDQLGKQNSKGVVSVSIGKILNRGHMFLVGNDEADLAAKADISMKRFWNQFRHLAGRVIDIRIIGVLCHLNGPAVVEDIKLLTDLQLLHAHPLCLPHTADFLLFQRMMRRLDHDYLPEVSP
jgi:hypothetical protein